MRTALRRVASRARAAVRARARRALRALDELAEYVVLRTEDFLVVVWPASALEAPTVTTGKLTARPASNAQTRTTFIGRIERTNPPSRLSAGWEQPDLGKSVEREEV